MHRNHVPLNCTDRTIAHISKKVLKALHFPHFHHLQPATGLLFITLTYASSPPLSSRDLETVSPPAIMEDLSIL